MASKGSREETPVLLTAKAIEQVKTAINRERQAKESGLRLLLVDAGSGFRYDLQFETKNRPNDLISIQGGIKIYVDKAMAPYFQGMLLDAQDVMDDKTKQVTNSVFVFRRPHEEAGSSNSRSH